MYPWQLPRSSRGGICRKLPWVWALCNPSPRIHSPKATAETCLPNTSSREQRITRQPQSTFWHFTEKKKENAVPWFRLRGCETPNPMLKIKNTPKMIHVNYCWRYTSRCDNRFLFFVRSTIPSIIHLLCQIWIEQLFSPRVKSLAVFVQNTRTGAQCREISFARGGTNHTLSQP